MSEKIRERIVVASIIAISVAVIWGVAEMVFGGDQWFDSHWKLLGLVWGSAFLVAAFNVALMCRVYESPVVKTVAACAIIAAAVVLPAQAGDPIQYENYAAYNWVTRAWTWLTSSFTVSDYAQGASTTNQNPNQALANNAAYGLQQVPAPNGPQAPAGGEGKWRSKDP